MEPTQKRDSYGPYFQYGDSGEKYRYSDGNELTKEQAKSKAMDEYKSMLAIGNGK